MEKPTSEPKCEEVPADGTWPPQPAPLGKHGALLYLGIATDVACILAAVPFLILAGAAARLDGRVAPPDQWNTLYAAMNAVGELSNPTCLSTMSCQDASRDDRDD